MSESILWISVGVLLILILFLVAFAETIFGILLEIYFQFKAEPILKRNRKKMDIYISSLESIIERIERMIFVAQDINVMSRLMRIKTDTFETIILLRKCKRVDGLADIEVIKKRLNIIEKQLTEIGN